MKYGITNKKIVHIIRENSGNGLGGYWDTVCGKWIRPVDLMDVLPDGARMCAHCQKYKEADHG